MEKSYGDSQPTYELYFEPPQLGDEETHIVRVLAWDGNGNSTMKVYTVTYHQISEGDPAGSVDVVLDATTIGLGILDTGTLDIVEAKRRRPCCCASCRSAVMSRITRGLLP